MVTYWITPPRRAADEDGGCKLVILGEDLQRLNLRLAMFDHR